MFGGYKKIITFAVVFWSAVVLAVVVRIQSEHNKRRKKPLRVERGLRVFRETPCKKNIRVERAFRVFRESPCSLKTPCKQPSV